MIGALARATIYVSLSHQNLAVSQRMLYLIPASLLERAAITLSLCSGNEILGTEFELSHDHDAMYKQDYEQ